MQTTSDYRCNKRLQRLPKKIINAFVIFVNVYYFNERQVKCRKANSGAFSGGLFCSNCLGMNFADCCMNEVEFRICTNRNNMQ